MKTPLSKRPSAIYILTGFGKKTLPGWQIFHQVSHFCEVADLPFKHTQMIHAGCVKVAPGKSQTGRVKFKISPGRLNFQWLNGKNPLGWVSLGLLKRSVKGVLHSARISASEVNNQFSLIWS